MESFRLSNFRSLKKTGDLALRPITIFVGANSSGKSSALRVLPLFKQSVPARSSVPLLWYGDLVDFGDVNTTKASYSSDDYLHVGMSVALSQIYSGYWREDLPKELSATNLEYDLWLQEGEDRRTQLHRFTLRVNEDTIDVTLDPTSAKASIKFNGHSLDGVLLRSDLSPSIKGLVPTFKGAATSATGSAEDLLPSYVSWMLGDVAESILEYFKERLHGNTSRTKVAAIAARFRYCNEQDFKARILAYRGRDRWWTRYTESVRASGGDALKELRGLYFMAFLTQTNVAFSEYMRLLCKCMSYIAPVRATGQRYYRFQELSVDQIDPQGKNLAMFLNSLTSQRLKSFSAWVSQQIGYDVKVLRSEGHVSICLAEEGSSDFRNIADMGYGFSQILPIMAQIWLNMEGSLEDWEMIKNPPFICTIEQPELHLHPAYQEAFADTMAASVSKCEADGVDGRRIRFLVETHSEAILNRLGDLVADGALKADDVAIYVFEKQLSGATDVKLAEFRDNGVLKNWPFGFFRRSL